jgi:hypothetical protein
MLFAIFLTQDCHIFLTLIKIASGKKMKSNMAHYFEKYCVQTPKKQLCFLFFKIQPQIGEHTVTQLLSSYHCLSHIFTTSGWEPKIHTIIKAEYALHENL